MRGLAVLVLATVLHAAPAAGLPDARCSQAPGTERPTVHTIGGTVRVDNRCNGTTPLVVVWKMYENSSETFYAPARAYTAAPTLHTGRIKVWLRFPDGSEYLYSKRMK